MDDDTRRFILDAMAYLAFSYCLVDFIQKYFYA